MAMSKELMEKMISRRSIEEMIGNQALTENFLGALIYQVHKDDTEETAADRFGMGALWRNETEFKTLEMCNMHLGACDVCWKRFQDIIGHYSRRPSKN